MTGKKSTVLQIKAVKGRRKIRNPKNLRSSLKASNGVSDSLESPELINSP